MNPFRHILVPVDFDPPSLHALRVGVELALTFDAELTVLHAWDIVPYEYIDPIYFSVGLRSDLETAAKLQLNETVARVRAQVPQVHGLLATGPTASAVFDAIRTTNADLVVMGTHGRSGVARLLLGSVAEKVVRASPVPVLTVRKDSIRTGAEEERPNPAMTTTPPQRRWLGHLPRPRRSGLLDDMTASSRPVWHSPLSSRWDAGGEHGQAAVRTVLCDASRQSAGSRAGRASPSR